MPTLEELFDGALSDLSPVSSGTSSGHESQAEEKGLPAGWQDIIRDAPRKRKKVHRENTTSWADWNSETEEIYAVESSKRKALRKKKTDVHVAEDVGVEYYAPEEIAKLAGGDINQDLKFIRSLPVLPSETNGHGGNAKKSKPTPSGVKSGPITRLFTELHTFIQSQNPIIFELPREIKECFDDIIAHPATGAFMDAKDIEIITIGSRSSRAAKSLDRGLVVPLNGPTPSVSRGSEKALNYIDDAAYDIDISQPHSSAFCFKCQRSGLRPSPMTLMDSNVVGQPIVSELALIPQRSRSAMVRCDYCYLWWHLDCLDPPQLLVPSELRHEPEVINVRHVKDMRAKFWGKWACDASDIAMDRSRARTRRANEEVAGVALNLRKKDETSSSELSISSAVSTLNNANVVQLRKKWMCPCHADWCLPKTRRPRRWKVVTLDEKSEAPDTMYHDKIGESFSNDGHVDIILAPDEPAERPEKKRSRKSGVVRFLKSASAFYIKGGVGGRHSFGKKRTDFKHNGLAYSVPATTFVARGCTSSDEGAWLQKVDRRRSLRGDDVKRCAKELTVDSLANQQHDTASPLGVVKLVSVQKKRMAELLEMENDFCVGE
ncbi:hypothetical protein HDU67_009564 [Dinochytrium kinnereticum]|nr:hypothetical protein HDU67_009564 [Dinochytrium kinnereticum]